MAEIPSAAPVLPVPPHPPSTAPWKRPAIWLQAAAGTVIGGALMFVALRAVRGLSGIEALALCVSLPVLLWLQVLLHEAGHAFAGLLSGHRVLAIGLGPLRVNRVGDAWQFSWAGSIKSIAGFVLSLPERDDVSRRDATVYLLGGPLANLLVAAIAWPWVMANPDQAASFGQVIARLVLGTGLLVGLVNLLPFLAGGWSSDGRQLIKLWQGSDEAKALLFLRRLGAMSSAGVRPRDWHMPALHAAQEDQLPPSVSDALAQCWLLKSIDEGTPNTKETFIAARLLVDGFWAGPEALRPAKALLVGRWLLLSGGDPSEVNTWAELAVGGVIDQSAELALLKGLIALKRKNHAEAERHMREAAALRQRVQPGAGLSMFDDDLAMLQKQLSESREARSA